MAKKITWEIALKVATAVIARAGEDVRKKNLSPDLQSNAPIAVCVCGLNFQPKVTISMDDAMPISSDNLCEDKAYTVLRTLTPTLYWESKGVNPRNFVDTRITCFGGGVPIKDRHGKVIGAIGVSGRKSHSTKGRIPDNEVIFPQDHELALHGLEIFKQLVSKKSQKP